MEKVDVNSHDEHENVLYLVVVKWWVGWQWYAVGKRGGEAMGALEPMVGCSVGLALLGLHWHVWGEHSWRVFGYSPLLF